MAPRRAGKQHTGGNRLAECASPYLRQHADNPVDWLPWCDEALERARTEGKPILLSIGYSACHWCHVMARECFEDAEIARRMNEGFVCIKVDREERPDLDELYMRAVQLMTGSGGWPLTVFLRPDLVPFYGGTYFPPEDQHGLPGLPRVLAAVTEAFHERRGEVDSTADAVREALSRAAAQRAPVGLTDEVLQEALRSVAAGYDLAYGGFGSGPKFPQAPLLDWLLRLWGTRGEPRARFMVETTLGHMAAGGVHDQVGGGFCRYSVDGDWSTPHFEKMLCDNAQLAGLYADASRALGRRDFLGVARRAADYAMGVLRSPEGAFHAAQSAESEGAEGAYYAWSRAEVLDCLGQDEGARVADYLGISEQGNWTDGLSVPRRAALLARVPEDDSDLYERDVAPAVAKLLARRNTRVPPETDLKILSDWNGLMVSGLVRVWRATGDRQYLAAAADCARFLWERLRPDGRLLHGLCEGRPLGPAFLADHAAVATGLLDLYECEFEDLWLGRACELTEGIVRVFWDERTGLLREGGEQNERLFAPAAPRADDPAPSGRGSACDLLLRVGALCGEGRCEETARRALEGVGSLLEDNAQHMGTTLSAVLRSLSGPNELVIVEEQGGPLRRAADEFYLPHLVLAGCEPGAAGSSVPRPPLLAGKEGAGLAAYVCSGGVCRLPVRLPERLREELATLLPKR